MKLRALFALLLLANVANAQQDPRVGLKAGFTDAGVAALNMALVSNTPRPDGFFLPAGAPSPLPAGVNPLFADILFANSDLTFKGNMLYMGNFHGFQVFDLTNPRTPKLVTAYECPGGQGDISVYGNLLFMSVEMPNSRIDCKEGGFNQQPGPDRFLGVRIFDMSDIAHPKQVGFVQTCRGSHTHTLVTDAKDADNVYLYVSGVDQPRPATELAGCSGATPEQDPNTSYFRIEVIKVPVKAPQTASIVNMPRIFADSGKIAGLNPGGAHGPGTQSTARTDQCHDITAYPEMHIAGGACAGNGLLLDITDPANPKRVTQVADPNFAYWHSATFSNDASKVLFTDEWGGGLGPRCQATDKKEWGADAIFDLKNFKLTPASYYKMPAAQTELENCVAHNGSLIPVPGRDIMVQGWYQGGISIFDFTDAKKPVEIAYFDRGPYETQNPRLGGFWSAYWYNGLIYASEIQRGLDVFELKPSRLLSQNEIDAAKLVQLAVFNPQTQPHIVWPANIVVARAYVDQLRRSPDIAEPVMVNVIRDLDTFEHSTDPAHKRNVLLRAASAATFLGHSAKGLDLVRLNALGQLLKELAK